MIADFPAFHICPQCGITLTLEALLPAASHFDAVASALIDHLVPIEEALTHVRHLLEEGLQ